MNKIVNTMLERRSVRNYLEKIPEEPVLKAVMKAGQSAPFAFQAYSFLVSRDREKNPFNAPLYFIACVDLHKMDLIMQKRGWKRELNDVFALMLSGQDAAYAVQNMVTAAESFGMGSCYLGGVPYAYEKIKREYGLPGGVFPLVGLAMGYPADEEPVRPRYPASFVFFEEKYPEFTDGDIEEAMDVMDKGYMDQDYYKKAGYMISRVGMEEKFDFDTYGWTEHISRKLSLGDSESKKY